MTTTTRIYLPPNSQHKRVPLNTQFGYLKITSEPFHLINEPKRVSYEFECTCGTKCIKFLSEVIYNAKSYPPHCGCKSLEHLSMAKTINNPKCIICGTTDYEAFAPTRKNICKTCRKNKKKFENKILLSDPAKRSRHNLVISQAQQRSPENYLKQLLSSTRAKQKTVDIDIKHLMLLFESQNGMCAITNIPMTHRYKSLYSISIDRIDNNHDYTTNNIQLVCKFINLGRRQHTISEFINILFNKQNKVEYATNEIRQYFRKLLASIRPRCCGKHCKPKLRHHNLTLDFLCQLYTSQNGICAATNTPMILQSHFLNSCSADRIDNAIGYKQDNIQLVCIWANIARRNHSVEEFAEAISLMRIHYPHSSNVHSVSNPAQHLPVQVHRPHQHP